MLFHHHHQYRLHFLLLFLRLFFVFTSSSFLPLFRLHHHHHIIIQLYCKDVPWDMDRLSTSQYSNITNNRPFIWCRPIYTTKIGRPTFVCPPHISETVAVRIMKLAHHPRIASTTNKLLSKQILLSILSIIF